MSLRDIPITISILAAGYLFAIYLLLILAQRTTNKLSQELSSHSSILPSSILPISMALEERAGQDSFGSEEISRALAGERSEGEATLTSSGSRTSD